MQLSAEVRWFGLGSLPDDLKSWFLGRAHAFRYSAGGGHSRTDVYLLLKETELSIKKRGGKRGFEVKGLVDAIPWAFQRGESRLPRSFCASGAAPSSKSRMSLWSKPSKSGAPKV